MTGRTIIFPERNPKTIQQATLCILRKKKNNSVRILLGMKKRGFGTNLWNGFGGKVKNEGIEEAAMREVSEEVGVKIESQEKVAVLHFYFPDDPVKKDWNQDVHVYMVDNWYGLPKETEEMKPKWFDINKIPYRRMWDDDSVWLPKVLDGKRIIGYFIFNDDNKVIAHRIKEVKKFE